MLRARLPYNAIQRSCDSSRNSGNGSMTSRAEVVGDAGLLVAADDPADIAAGILRAVGPEHDGLGRAARARSAAFTWAHAADQTVQAHRAAIAAQHLAGPPRGPRSVR